MLAVNLRLILRWFFSLQAASWGHDSYEDARACVELMLWKVQRDLPMFGAKSDFEDDDQSAACFADFVHVDQFTAWTFWTT